MAGEKKVLVTGGAGFIGSHLCERLVNEGHDVIALDNLFTGRKKNVAKFLNHINFDLIYHDVTQPYYIDGIDQIYNLACPASPVHYQFDPVKTTRTSFDGALNMLGMATRLKIPMLQASTSEIYGDPDIHPQPESYVGKVNPIGPRACYDEGKRAAEALCFDYYRERGTAIRVVRIFNTYGPNMHPDDGRVVSNFIVQALRNEDITIYGDGQQTRSFQYVDDLVEGMVTMMNNKDDFTGPVNIGNPGEFTIKALAEKVLAMIPESKSQIIFKELPEDDPRQRQPDISLAKEKLGWEPTIQLDEGLERTIDYFRDELGSEDLGH